MKPESEAQRQARLDREANRNFRISRGLRRSASYRSREGQADWEAQHRPAPAAAPTKPDPEKT